MKIAILGLWHQGVVAAGCLAGMGHDVVAADLDSGRVAVLRERRAPIFEPGLDDLLGREVAAGRLSFSNDYIAAVRDAQYVFAMFDTPVNDNDESDLSGIFHAFEVIAPVLAPQTIVLVTAQVPVGTCDALENLLGKAANGPTIAYMPENLRL